ncbi:MAG TPA: ferrous iron transport protein B [Deltaproteobacteria bacterium]|nr:ferrous iron transport protein B [Deltaproteobacteria bacterium]HPP80515.1 ferrous iron transport protein B [Deltaproteobacteria bacterium]
MTPRQGEIVIALAGQPNCGKSTIFNAVAGFKVNTGNFPGTTVSYTETTVFLANETVRLIDLPGTYSISSVDPAEKVARDFLLSGSADVVINVLDSSILGRSLELTVQLMEMNVPMVMALNMHDEALDKGIDIDVEKLRELTGVEAYPVVAVEGKGVRVLFEAAVRVARSDFKPVKPVYDRDVEECIARILSAYPERLRSKLPLDSRFVVIRLLEMDEEFERIVWREDADFLSHVIKERKALAELHNWPEAGVFSSHRHAYVFDLFEAVAKVSAKQKVTLREHMDRFITNPAGGIATVLAILFLMFLASFTLGDIISGLLEQPLGMLDELAAGLPEGALQAVVSGLIDGVVSGMGIVLPYLLPLLAVMAMLEDSGLLPRIAFMVDGILHRFGMHGKAAIPLILGYGCSVPAVMAARNMEYERDRIVTMLTVPFIACSARSVVILALAGKYLGAGVTTAVYAANILVTLMVAFFLSRMSTQAFPGIIMDVPPLRRPYPRIVANKVWWRLREFLVFAWPVIIVSSVALAFLEKVGIDGIVNRALSPVTSGLLALPEATGVTLFFGIFRKELTLAMLNQALGAMDLASVLSSGQILVLTVFSMLYIPCVATLTTLWKEGGIKIVLSSILLNTTVALLAAGGLSWVLRAF